MQILTWGGWNKKEKHRPVTNVVMVSKVEEVSLYTFNIQYQTDWLLNSSQTMKTNSDCCCVDKVENNFTS